LLDAQEPKWQPKEDRSLLYVVLSSFRKGSSTTWVEAHSQMDEPGMTRRSDAAAKLRAFHDWLDSVPPVPHIPLEEIDREHLY